MWKGDVHRVQKRTSDVLEWKVQDVVSFLSREEEFKALCKGSKCYEPLSHLPQGWHFKNGWEKEQKSVPSEKCSEKICLWLINDLFWKILEYGLLKTHVCIFTKPGQGFVWLWQCHLNKECWRVLTHWLKTLIVGLEGWLIYMAYIYLHTWHAYTHT